MSKTVLITGGAGFIGSHIAEQLVANKHKVIVLDDLSSGYVDNLPKKAELIVGSVLNSELVDNVFTAHKPSIVYHCAAFASENMSHDVPELTFSTNFLSIISLVRNLINSKDFKYQDSRFVFLSSAAVYGNLDASDEDNNFHNEWEEDDLCLPIDPYGQSKLAAEQYIKLASSTFGLPYTTFRLHNVYGERQSLVDASRNVIGRFIYQSMKGQPLTAYGDGKQTRQFTYIGDIAEIISRCHEDLSTQNQTYNLGADFKASVINVADFISSNTHNTGIEFLPARQEVNSTFVNHAKAIAQWGKIEKTPLDVGLLKMIYWAEKNPHVLNKMRLLPEREIIKKRL